MRKEITAKFTSRCAACGSDIHPGDVITYDPAVKYSSRHKSCPAAAGVKQNPKPKVAPGTMLNSPVIAQPQVTRLSDEAAAKILEEIGSAFVRPLPSGTPTLGIGYEVEIVGKKLKIGTCGPWVGTATDWGTLDGKYGSGDLKERQSEPTGHVISLIDGAVLESAPWQKSKGIDYWTRQLGAPVKREMSGKHTVAVGDIEHVPGASGWYIVISVDKPYFLSAEDAEDFDLFERGGGWGTPYELREISAPTKGAEAEAEAKYLAKKAARAALDGFEKRVRELGPSLENLPAGATVLRKWSTAAHPSYGSPFYHAVYALELPDGRKAYRYTDDFYDWPIDMTAVVEEFFTDEPPATEVLK
jgi:hypothetical protein